MKWILSSVLPLLFATFCVADITFEGESKVPQYTIAKIRPKSSDFKSFIVKVFSSDGKRLKVEQGKDGWILFTGRPGEYRVEAVAGKTDKDGNLELAEGEFRVTIEGKEPEPPKPPTPPTPDDSDGKLGLKKASREGMRLVMSLDRTGQAKKLANAQRVHASKVAAGVYSDKAKILEAWRTINKETLTTAEQQVWSPWAAMVKLKVEEVDKTNKLSGNEDWSDVFKEIADGLEFKVQKGK